MTVSFVLLILLTIVPTLVGRVIGDSAAKKLDTENRAKLVEFDTPYWMVGPIILVAGVLLLIYNNPKAKWLFAAAAVACALYSVGVVLMRRRVLVQWAMPRDFVGARTVSMVLQMSSSVMLALGLFLVWP